MTDLGEALAAYDAIPSDLSDEAQPFAPIVAAARNWRALTTPSDGLVERIVVVLDAWSVANDWHTVAKAVLDALTDTADETS